MTNVRSRERERMRGRETLETSKTREGGPQTIVADWGPRSLACGSLLEVFLSD